MNFLICSFQLTVEMFDYLECELNLFLGGEFFCSIGPATSMLSTHRHRYSLTDRKYSLPDMCNVHNGERKQTDGER